MESGGRSRNRVELEDRVGKVAVGQLGKLRIATLCAYQRAKQEESKRRPHQFDSDTKQSGLIFRSRERIFNSSAATLEVCSHSFPVLENGFSIPASKNRTAALLAITASISPEITLSPPRSRVTP